MAMLNNQRVIGGQRGKWPTKEFMTSNHYCLVVLSKTPLKNDGVRQLGL